MKTGILGGTFNPIHLAHLAIAEDVQQTFSLDRVLFIPAASPPHKEIAGDVPFTHRMAMVEAATKASPAFQTSDIEYRRSGKSFSVDTLGILKQENPDDHFFFIIGMDSYRDIASWKEFERLFSLCDLVVTTRPGVEINNPLGPLPVAIHKDFCYDTNTNKIHHKSGYYVHFLANIQLNISSTSIREKLYQGEPVKGVIPAIVEEYIVKHNLYQREKRPGSQ